MTLMEVVESKNWQLTPQQLKWRRDWIATTTINMAKIKVLKNNIHFFENQ